MAESWQSSRSPENVVCLLPPSKSTSPSESGSDLPCRHKRHVFIVERILRRKRCGQYFPLSTQTNRKYSVSVGHYCDKEPPCGRGSLAVKVTDSCLAYHGFEPGTAEGPPCRGGRYTLNLSMLKRPPVGVEWKLGKGVPSQVTSSLDHGSKLQGRRQKSP
ncbi:hypothetical protein TNCV_2104021 [Trichonephila clavipes]|nr:hypothetical protein TNCV_2104021 [Trichonephila clavipes]